jgi:F-type H+-transporting ATPase subunit delta
MSILIAKKYVKALVKDCDIDKLSQINDDLKLISTAYASEKFNNIISSVDTKASEKVSLINSFIETPSSTLINLVKLLSENKRLNIIPSISKELDTEVSKLTNTYVGIVYSNEALNDDYISKLEADFAKKFDCKLSLINNVCDYDGIKVNIDGLGVEISFAKNIFKSQMIEHILQAV